MSNYHNTNQCNWLVFWKVDINVLDIPQCSSHESLCDFTNAEIQWVGLRINFVMPSSHPIHCGLYEGPGPVSMCLGSVESWILLYFPNRDWPWNLTLDPILAKKKAVYLARECFLNSFYFQQNNLALIYQASNYWIKLYLTIPDQASVLC